MLFYTILALIKFQKTAPIQAQTVIVSQTSRFQQSEETKYFIGDRCKFFIMDCDTHKRRAY